MTMTHYFCNTVLIDHALRNQAYSPPSTLYLGCFTVTPTKAGGGTELTGGAYARQSVALSAGSSSTTSNTATVTFPTATASLGTIIVVGVFDAVSAGNLLLYQVLNQSRGPIVINDVYRFLAGELDFTFD